MSLTKNILVSFILLFVFTHVNAQTTLDTLSTKLNANISVDEKLDAIKNSTNELLLSNPDTLIYYCNYALKMCDKYDKQSDQIFFLQALSEAYYNISNYSEALKITFEAIKICENSKDSSELSSFYNNLGSIYRVSGKLDESTKYHRKALDICLLLKDTIGIASSYNNIGIGYMMESKYDTGMSYWAKSLEMKLSIGDSVGAATTMNNMAMYYRDIGQTEKALDFYSQVLRIKQNIQDHASISMAYLNLGELFYQKEDYEKSLDYYRKALKEAERSKGKQLISHAYFRLSETYYAKKDYKLAYDNYVTHKNMRDSIFNEETTKNLEVVESKYENEKKALLIENLEKEKKAQDTKQKYIILSGSTGLLALLIIIFIVTKNYRQKKRDNLLISEQKAIVEEKNQEITDSITYARRLQNAILPPTELVKSYLPNSFILFQPKDVVSGDFYWAEKINDKILIAAADCTGHGVPGAMVSVVCSNALNRATKEFKLEKPSEILNKTRALVIETFEKSNESVKDGMDIALCSIDIKNNKLEYAGANNPLWILRNNQTEIVEIKADKQPIGVYNYSQPFTNHEVEINKEDTLFLFSDGYADQFGGEKGKKLKYKPFKELLIISNSFAPEKQKEFLLKKFKEWKGKLEQVDDICVIGVKV